MPLSPTSRKSPQSHRIVNIWGESWVRKASGKIETIPDDGAMLPGYRFLEQAWVIGGFLIAAGAIWIILGLVRWSRRRPVTSWIGRPVVGLVLGGVLVVGGLVLGTLHELRPGQSAEIARASMADELRQYKLVDTDGQPFADAALSEREDTGRSARNNFWLAPSFVTRLAHLGWGFGPSVSALGLQDVVRPRQLAGLGAPDV